MYENVNVEMILRRNGIVLGLFGLFLLATHLSGSFSIYSITPLFVLFVLLNINASVSYELIKDFHPSQTFQKQKFFTVNAAIIISIPALLVFLGFQEGLEKIIDQDFDLRIMWSGIASIAMIFVTHITNRNLYTNPVKEISSLTELSWISLHLKDVFDSSAGLPSFENIYETSEAFKIFIKMGYYQALFVLCQLSLMHYKGREKIDLTLGFFTLIFVSIELYPLLKTAFSLLLDGIPPKVNEVELDLRHKIMSQKPSLANSLKFSLTQPGPQLLLIFLAIQQNKLTQKDAETLESTIMNQNSLPGIERHVFTVFES